RFSFFSSSIVKKQTSNPSQSVSNKSQLKSQNPHNQQSSQSKETRNKGNNRLQRPPPSSVSGLIDPPQLISQQSKTEQNQFSHKSLIIKDIYQNYRRSL
ncbi:hypothetical protein, partial [Oryzifoliimicrobium ureilyticus]|uniref:hypothetical protein n=1 Tax=Oryzifoliimicrobium ureilyticus TaxID=3113724 RepID=UPI003076785E